MATFEANYILGEELGKGAYATVYRCTNRITNKTWAVKVVDKSKAGPKDISDLNHEVKVMKEIGEHPYVVQLHESFDTPSHMFLVMDILEGGMLFDRIVQMNHYSERDASRLIKNFLLALEHIHSKNIIHRDLKPENLLLKRLSVEGSKDASSLTDVALADFGLAGYSPGSTCCGSPTYIAPEVINVGYLRTQKEPYDGKCDVWSLGVIAYILLSGKMPFHGRNFKEIFSKIVKGQWSFTGTIWDSVSETAKDFIKTMLTLDPSKRPTAKEALGHPWVADVQPDVHLPGSIENIKVFNAQQKLRGAVAVFRATTSLLGNLDRTPPFMKYLVPSPNPVSTVVTSKSQTDNTKLHFVNYGNALSRKTDGWKMQDCCTCGSKMVCRHIQNVHEYLFVGSRQMDAAPFINELLTLQEEIKADMEDNPSPDLVKKLDEVENTIEAAYAFHEEFLKVPTDIMKPNLMLQTPVGGKAPTKSTLLSAFKKK